MVTYHHLVDISFGGVVALAGFWCATSRRPWAVRWGIVAAIASTSLFANAFQPVMQAVSAAVILSVSVAAWRWWTGEAAMPRLRSLSLRNLLLMTGFCAVVSAIAARTPEFAVFDWGGMLGTGLATALPTLFAAWLVFGPGSWAKRSLVGLGSFLALGVAGYGLRGLWYWFTYPDVQDKYSSFFHAVIDWFSWNQLGWQWQAFGPTLLLGTAVLCIVLTGAKHSGWFGASRRGHLSARVALISPLLLMSYLDLRVLWELSHPTPIPVEETIDPNGWDEIEAAGSMVADGKFYSRQRIKGMSQAELASQIEKWSPLYAQIDAALQTPVKALSPYLWLREKNRVAPTQAQVLRKKWIAAFNAGALLWAKTLDAEQRKDTSAELKAALQQLNLRLVKSREEAASDLWQHPPTGAGQGNLSRLLDKLSIEDANLVLKNLLRFDAEWPMFDLLEARQRIIDENHDWMEHLQLLLDDWSGVDHYKDERVVFDACQAMLRLTLVEYALRLYRQESGRYPATLTDLTPEYLPAVPVDPFSKQPFRYRTTSKGYLLYSVGRDQIDDGGEPAKSYWSQTGDLTTEVFLAN